MPPRKMKMPAETESEPEARISQRIRPALGRFLLQVDRQTKSSFPTAETAQSAGLAIKKIKPILHVTVYDTVDYAETTIALPESS
jgi:hypothetical protein